MIRKAFFYDSFSGTYSRMSPGVQSSSLQMSSRVENLIALALPLLSMERLAMVIPILSESSVSDILFFASCTSRLVIIGILYGKVLFFLYFHST